MSPSPKSSSAVPSRPRARGREASETLLREAALRLIERDGVLSGLRLTDIADEAGLSRGLINRYFVTRQSLLRSALASKRRAIEGYVMRHRREPPERWMPRQLRMAAKDPEYGRVMALLAIDGDDAFEPLPWFDEAMADARADIDAGVRADRDPAVTSALVAATTHGWALFRESFARQIGVPVKELDARAEAVFTQMLAAVVLPQPTEGPESP